MYSLYGMYLLLPTEAIEYGKKSIGKPRYHFEQLKMK